MSTQREGVMIKIVTDSTTNLSKSLTDEYDITVLPTYLYFLNNVYRDGIDISSSEFYKILLELDELPTTSQVPVKDFTEAYRRLSQENPGATLIAIHCS